MEGEETGGLAERFGGGVGGTGRGGHINHPSVCRCFT